MLRMKSTRVLSRLIHLTRRRRTTNCGCANRTGRIVAFMLALAGILQFPPLPSGAQVLSRPSPLSAGLTPEGDTGAFLPVHRLTMTLLDDAGRPVAGASFSGRHFSGDGNAGEAPLTDERGTA